MLLMQVVQQWGFINHTVERQLTYFNSSPIRDHVIVWSHPINTLAHLVIAKDNILGPCEFKLQVFQEIGGTKDIVFIGSLTINLSEYANNGLTSRRYLLDECKFNSTIKVKHKKQVLFYVTQITLAFFSIRSSNRVCCSIQHVIE